jgi:hypothetical protein
MEKRGGRKRRRGARREKKEEELEGRAIRTMRLWG